MAAQGTSTRRRPRPHLPDGVAPGPQSRRRQVGGAVATGVGAVLGGSCLAVLYLPLLGLTVYGLIYAALNPDDVAPLGALFLAGLVALSAGIPVAAWFAYRKWIARPQSGHLGLTVAPLQLRRGEEVEARVELAQAPKNGRVEVGLVLRVWYDEWRTTTSSSGGVGSTGSSSRRTRATAQAVAYEEWRPAQPLAGSQAFRFRVPERAPFSHEGDCLSFAWMVRAREPRAGARDPHQDEPLWVVP